MLLCLSNASQPALPQGVAAFQANPHFASRTRVVAASLTDPNEAGFYSELGVPPGSAPAVVFMAPPGVYVGKFDANVSMQELATKLQGAGKCCSDPNCKHNH